MADDRTHLISRRGTGVVVAAMNPWEFYRVEIIEGFPVLCSYGHDWLLENIGTMKDEPYSMVSDGNRPAPPTA